MLTSIQLFRREHKLTTCALGEPSITLVQNDSRFGVLLASGAHEDSFTSRFYLDEATYLCVSGRRWRYADFDSVAIYREEGVWFARDMAQGGYFPNPSHRPYHVIFISYDEFRTLQNARAEGLAFPVFEFAQKHFGRLPGFSFRARSLETPDDYATQGDAVPFSEYVLTA